VIRSRTVSIGSPDGIDRIFDAVTTQRNAGDPIPDGIEPIPERYRSVPRILDEARGFGAIGNRKGGCRVLDAVRGPGKATSRATDRSDRSDQSESRAAERRGSDPHRHVCHLAVEQSRRSLGEGGPLCVSPESANVFLSPTERRRFWWVE
jgi:hypothetical protein